MPNRMLTPDRRAARPARRAGAWPAGSSPAKRGRCAESTARCPLARTAPACLGLAPVLPAGHQIQPRGGVGLHHVGRRAAGVARPLDALHGAVRRDADLHRPARARCASSSSVNRTAVASVARGVAAGSARQASRACRPSGTGIRRRAGMAPMVPLTHVTPASGNGVRPLPVGPAWHGQHLAPHQAPARRPPTAGQLRVAGDGPFPASSRRTSGAPACPPSCPPSSGSRSGSRSSPASCSASPSASSPAAATWPGWPPP